MGKRLVSCPEVALVGTVPVGTMPVGILPVGTMPCTRVTNAQQVHDNCVTKVRNKSTTNRGNGVWAYRLQIEPPPGVRPL